MSCVWNRRLASSLLIWLSLAAGPAAATGLALADSSRVDGEVRRFLADDRKWLAQQPARQLVAPAAAGADTLLAWLRGQRRQRNEVATVVTGQRDLLSMLRDRWQERGYLAATVELAGGAVVVNPGPVYRFGELQVTGPEFPDRQRLLDAALPRRGDRFRAEDLDRAIALLLSGAGERGFPFASWEIREVALRPADAAVDVAATLHTGERAVVGRQHATVAGGRGERFLIRTAGVETGAGFRESYLERGVQRLLARGLYEEVQPPELYVDGRSDTVGIVWRVTPRPRPNRLAVVLGLSRRQGDATTRMSGSVDLRLPNLGGSGRSLTTAWSDDGARRSHFGFSFLEPLLLGTPLDVETTLDSEVQRDSYTRLRLDTVFRLPVVSLWWVEVGFGWDRTTYPTGDTERTLRRRARAAMGHRRGDVAANGWSGLFAIETARRSSNLRADATAAIGEDIGQRLIEGDLAGELWVDPTLSLAARASVRQIESDEQPVPLSEQYRFGGATTLRGYREDELRGATAAWGGAEIRLGRVHRSRVYTFVDAGYFELAGAKGDAWGFGLGIIARAAVGEINLAIGFPGQTEFTTAKLHVSLAGAF